MKANLSLINLLLLFTIIKCETEDQKYYFQLDIPQDKDKPYLFYAYTPSSKFLTINTTEKNNCTIIETKKIEQSVTKNLSSIIIYKNELELVIKTCFNPNILVEIKNGNIIKKKSKNLSNVKYCYSNAIYSSDNQNDHAIITYWVEYELKYGKEVYTHKCMLYYINTQVFSNEIILTTPENFYSERCITFNGTEIFCSISSDNSNYINYFTIETQKLFKNNNNHLVSSNVPFDKNVYQKIVSTNLRLNILFYEIFIIEYHNNAKNITKLNFQLYDINQRKVLSFKEGNYRSPELYIDLFYIEPSLFNMLFQKTNDTIISYIMKVGKKTNYVLSRYNLTKSIEAKNSTLLFSNYLRDDICSNPKYMQTNYITSFINYSEEDKSKIKNKTDDYYKYQRDIVSLITCLNKDNEIEYEPKKIVLPQCLNILDDLNNKNFHDINFYNDKNYVVFDIYGDPKYASLRNLDIQFYPGETEGKIIINYKEKGKVYKSYGTNDFNRPLRNITHIKFSKVNNMKKNEILTLRYRLMKSTIDGETYNCHLSSDICELNFTFIDGDPFPPSPVVCDYTIEGIIFDPNSFECICDVRKGFKREFDEENRVCVCKEGHSYYKNKEQCLPNDYLDKCKCIIKYDEITKIPIYDECPRDKTTTEVEEGICEIIDTSTCLDMNNLDLNLWFKLGEYKFYFAKINDCVYIFDDKNLTLFFYSNREDCSFKSEIIIQFIRICLNKPELTGVKEYNVFLDNAKEYDPNATNVTIFKKVEKIEEKDSIIKSILFNLVNGQSQENVSDVILPEHIISEIKNISNIPEELNLLIFKADMARTDTISTQVEYQIYNPIPSKIHQKIKFNITNITNDTYLRRLDDDDDGTTIYILTDKFDVKLNLPQDWPDDELEIIEELWHQKHIFIFDSSNRFFLDVCYKFTTSYNADIYLQDRKEKYYIQHPFCEEGCDLIDTHNYESNKMTCQCNLKIINDNYTNVSFYEIEPVEEFKKKYTFPNIKVMGCISKIKIFQAAITIFNLIFFVGFCITHRIRKCYNKDHDMFISLVDNIEEELNIFKKYHGIKDDKEKKQKTEEELKKEEEQKQKEEEKLKEKEREIEKKNEENLIKAYDDDNDDIIGAKKENGEQNNPNNEGNNDIHEKKEEEKDEESPLIDSKADGSNHKDESLISKYKPSSIKENKINDTKSIDSNQIESEILTIKTKKSKKKSIDSNQIESEISTIKTKKSKKKSIDSNQIESEILTINTNKSKTKRKKSDSQLNDSSIIVNNPIKISVDKFQVTENKDSNDKKKNEDNKKDISIMEKLNSDRYDKDSNISKTIHKNKEEDANNTNNDDIFIQNCSEEDDMEYEPPKENEDKDMEYPKDEENNKINKKKKSEANPPKRSKISKNEENVIHIEDGQNKETTSKDPTKRKREEDLLEEYYKTKKNKYLNRILDRYIYDDALEEDYRTFCQMFLGMISNNSTILFIFNKHDLFVSKKDKENEKKFEKEMEEKIKKKENENGDVKDENVDENGDENGDENRNENRNKNKKRNIKNIKENENEIENKENNKENNNLTGKANGDKKKKEHDGNDIFTRISVLILTIYIYIFVNILIMINGPSLHLYRRKDHGKFSFSSFLANFFLPYIIFYISILKLKKDLSVKEFIDEIYHKLYKFLYENHNKMDKRMIVNQIHLIIHNLETEISKKKNEHQEGMKRLLIGGLILILLNWYYMSCFLGIYVNSLDCLVVNLVLSVIYSLFVSFLVYLLSVSLRKCALPKEGDEREESCIKRLIFFISELFNPQYKYFCFCCCRKSFLSFSLCKCLSCFCSYICCCCWNEKNLQEYVEKDERQRRKKENKKKQNQKEEKQKQKQKQKEKNLLINDEKGSFDKKSKSDKKSQSDKTSVFTYSSKKKEEEKIKNEIMNESY